jgi:hypothetical protein
MSDIGLIMNALLGLLLVGALALGWRLEGRLKVLKASHQSFTRAVEDLDRAASRAEQGLADLRAATDEAAETLAARVERAGALSHRLEKLTAEATSAEARLIAAPKPQLAVRAEPRPVEARPDEARRAEARPAPTRDTAFARFAERYGAKVSQPVSALAEAAARNDLILEDEDELEAPTHIRAPALARRIAPEAVARIERLQALARTPAALATPSRPVDDELFDAPAPRAAAGGVR